MALSSATILLIGACRHIEPLYRRDCASPGLGCSSMISSCCQLHLAKLLHVQNSPGNCACSQNPFSSCCTHSGQRKSYCKQVNSMPVLLLCNVRTDCQPGPSHHACKVDTGLTNVLSIWRSTKPVAEFQVPSIIAVLKTARQLQLMDGLGQVMVPGQEPLSLPHRLLEKAVIHGSETIRLDVMQLACLHPKSTAFPGEKNCCPLLESRPCRCSKVIA